MATDPSQLIASLVGMPGLIGQQTQQNMLNSQQYALGKSQQQLVDMKVQQAQAEQGQQAQYQQDVSSWASAGAPAQGLTALIAKYPDQYKALQAGWQVKDDAQRTADLGYWGGVHAALQKGNTALATKIIQDRITAEQKAGLDTADDQQLLEGIQKGDRTAIDSVKGFSLAQIAAATGPAKFADTYDAVGDQDKSFTLTPGAKRFDAQGNVIASAPAAVHYERIQTVDADGNPVTQVVAVGGEGGGQASGGNGPGGSGPVDRLINSDAGGGYVPDSVKTLGQFVTYGKTMNARGAKSSSAGRYQINGSTMAEFAPQALGPDWRSQPFDGASQEKVGAAIFNWAKQQRDPAAALKGRWVSLTNDEAKRLVQGDWSQARGLIAQKETGGAPGASAAQPLPTASRAQVLYSAKGADAGSDAARLDDDTVAMMAQQYLAGDTSVMTNLWRGKQGAGNIVRFRTAIAQQARAQGMNGGQIANVMQDFKMHQQGLNAFAKGPEARTVRSLNVTIDHLDTLQNAAQALQNGNIQIFNKVGNAWAAATGKAAPTNFEAVKQIVSTEVAKAIVGGQTALGDRKDIAEGISRSNSPQQLAGWIAEAKKLLGGQLEGLAGQYKTATGRDDFGQRLSPRTRKALGYDRPTAPSAGGFRILQVRPK